MKETLERLSEITAPVCVTLILKTHKKHPENEKDPLLLKNLITEASNRLQKEYGAAKAKSYTEKLEKLAKEIDYRKNDQGLLLFVNDDIAEFLRVPVSPRSRVILDTTFATRTLVRALKRATDYYVLVLSRGKARLLEASSDHLIQEHKTEGFPFTDNDLQAAARLEATNASRVTNLTQEFFNRIDKSVNNIRRENPWPVIICSEETNYHDYLKVADNPNTIVGRVLLKNPDEKPGNLVKNLWPEVKELNLKRHRARVSELENALGTGKYLGDLNEIWEAVQEGKGKTIFVEEGYYQPARNDNGILTPIKPEEIEAEHDVNDVVDDMIEFTLKFGGDVVFLEEGGLEKFNKIALVTRY